MKLGKLLLATIGATVLLSALVGSASARSFSVTENRIRTAFRTVTFNGVFGNIRCAVTLEGSLHARSIAKTVGSLVGYINRAELGPCATGTATILRETLPWHGVYSGFTLTLPNIGNVRINFINASFRVREPFATCLARSTAANPAIGTFTRGVGGALTAEIGGAIPTSCGATGTFESDRPAVTVAGGATVVSVSLI